MNSENKLVFIPETKWDNQWKESGGNKAGNKLYTKIHNALNSLFSWREDKSKLKTGTRVVEYKLVPTGKVYNSLGEEL